MQDESLNEELRRLLEKGNKIDAIRLYYDTTGVGLKEAMQYVDKVNDDLRESLKNSGNAVNNDLLYQIHRHLRAGSKTKALKAYMDATGAELAAGKAYIDGLYKSLELDKKGDKRKAGTTVKPVRVEYEERRPMPEVEEITSETDTPEKQPMREYIPVEKERKQFSRQQRNSKTPLFLYVIIALLVAMFVYLLLIL